MRLPTIIIAFMMGAAYAKTLVVLQKADFSHAQEVKTGAQSHLQMDLTDRGWRKIQTLNQNHEAVASFKLGGKSYDWKLRGRITGHQLEAGPLSHAEAERIVHEVNGD